MKRAVREFLASFPFADLTKAAYGRVLSQLVVLPVADMTAADLVTFVSQPQWGSNQRHTALCACRKFIAWKFGRAHPALTARIKRGRPHPQPRLSADQVRALLAVLSHPRDLAIVGVALDCNLRCTELCHLEVRNIHLDTCKLFALVKGGKWCWKVFSETTAGYIRSWLNVREAALGVPTLFVSFRQQFRGQPLSRSGLQQIMKGWGKRVGFHVSPHMFRRSYASLSTLAGAPRSLVKKGGGWKSDQMVDQYIGDLELEATRPYLPMQNLS